MESFCFFHKAQQSSLTVAAITHTTHSLGLQTPFFHQSKKESIWTVNYIHTKQQQQGILLLVKILPQHNHQWMQKWKVSIFENVLLSLFQPFVRWMVLNIQKQKNLCWLIYVHNFDGFIYFARLMDRIIWRFL